MSWPRATPSAWYLLTPSATGSYVDGTWSNLANEPTERLYDGSNVMQNGNYFVVGGEYIDGSSYGILQQYRRHL